MDSFMLGVVVFEALAIGLFIFYINENRTLEKRIDELDGRIERFKRDVECFKDMVFGISSGTSRIRLFETFYVNSKPLMEKMEDIEIMVNNKNRELKDLLNYLNLEYKHISEKDILVKKTNKER